MAFAHKKPTPEQALLLLRANTLGLDKFSIFESYFEGFQSYANEYFPKVPDTVPTIGDSFTAHISKVRSLLSAEQFQTLNRHDLVDLRRHLHAANEIIGNAIHQLEHGTFHNERYPLERNVWANKLKELRQEITGHTLVGNITLEKGLQHFVEEALKSFPDPQRSL